MTRPTRRLPSLLVGVALVATACSGSDVAGTPEDDDETPASARDVCTPPGDLANGDVTEPSPTDDPFPWDRADPVVRAGFEPSEIIRGGPPPDGIMPIDDPCFDGVVTADEWLEPQSPVLVVEVEGDRRAYPLAIMTQHEIVNDVIGGVPVVVTYCPLCNSGLAFLRTVDGTVLDFGTSGRLYRSNLVMYDRQTRSLWTQFDGEAVMGEFVPTELERLPTALLGWEQFRQSTPDGRVLSRDSVPARTYGRNPYVGYESGGEGFLFRGPSDDRLPPGTRVVGLGDEDDAAAVPFPALQEERVVHVELGGDPVSVWWAPGQASALDEREIDAGRDVGSTGAFVPVAPDGTDLTFAPIEDRDDRFVDAETGSTWTILGEAVDGPLTGSRLEVVPRDDTFWFVWFAFRPETRVVR